MARRALRSVPGLVRIVTLAPEADPGLAATRALTDRGIVVASGTRRRRTTRHAQRPTPARVSSRTSSTAWARCTTARRASAGAALDDRRLVPSFIADLVHVHPAALRIALSARPDAVLVTDRVADSYATNVIAGADAVRLADGTLAGSLVTMEASVRNLVAIGVPVGLAVRTATGNPARVLGLDRSRTGRGRMSRRSRLARSRRPQSAGTVAGRRSARLVSTAPTTTNAIPASDSAATCSSRNTTPAMTATIGTK